MEEKISESEGGGQQLHHLGSGLYGTYADLRKSNMVRNQEKLISLGFGSARLPEPKSVKRNVDILDTSERQHQGKRKSSRIAKHATNTVGEKEEAVRVLSCVFCEIKSPFDYKYSAAMDWMKTHLEDNAACLVAQKEHDNKSRKRKLRVEDERDRSIMGEDNFLCCKNELCKWKAKKTGSSLTDRQTLNGHYNGCQFKTLVPKERRHTCQDEERGYVDGDGGQCYDDEKEEENPISVFDLGDDRISIIKSSVDDMARTPQAILNILQPLLDMMGVPSGVPSVSIAHQEASPQLASSLLQPCSDSDMSLMEKSDKRIFLIQQKILALLASPTRMRKDKDVTIVLQVYKTGVDLGLSDSGGDKFLATLKAVHDRATSEATSELAIESDFESDLIGTGLHQNWKSLRQAVEGDLFTIWKLHCKQIPLPEGLFPVEDLDGKAINHLDTFHYHIWDQLAAACLQINVDEFFFKPNPVFSKASADSSEQHRIYGPYSSGKLFEDISQATTHKFGSGAVSVCVGFFWDEAMAGKRHTACPLSMTIMNAFGDSYRTIFLGMCPVKLAYTDHYLGKLLAKGKPHPPTQAGIKFALRYAKRQALLKYLYTVLLPLKVHDSTGFKLQIGQGKFFTSRLLTNMIFSLMWYLYFI